MAPTAATCHAYRFCSRTPDGSSRRNGSGIMSCRLRRRRSGRSSIWRTPARIAPPRKRGRGRLPSGMGVTQGLVCVLSVVEPCRSFAVAPNRQTRRLEVVRRPRKCLHYYLYLIDPEFGWMHVRLQTWAPYEMQIYVNGREWLARQMDQAGIGYRRSDNKITDVDNFGPITALCGRFAHTNWPPVLERQAALVNPLLPDIERAGFPSY